jgi:hypothetical protein
VPLLGSRTALPKSAAAHLVQQHNSGKRAIGKKVTPQSCLLLCGCKQQQQRMQQAISACAAPF